MNVKEMTIDEFIDMLWEDEIKAKLPEFRKYVQELETYYPSAEAIEEGLNRSMA